MDSNALSVTTTEFRRNLATYLRIASEGGTVVVMSHGFRVAMLVAPEALVVE